ncbi:MAG TPA: hypothetical protein VF339_14690 [Gammaproteobacteria bacterium]
MMAVTERMLQAEAALRAEADRLMASGLLDVLTSYGSVHVVGSYMMRLMAWRDLDIHLVPDTMDRRTFFTLGGRIASLLSAKRMHYRDEVGGGESRLPDGLYWGVYLGDERKGAWKIDIWATRPEGLDRVRRYCEAIVERLTESRRVTILTIKSDCWAHPEYRRSFSSEDIYTAVLDHGVEDVGEFWRYLEKRAGRRIGTGGATGAIPEGSR